jgi:hypothetical protein
MTEFATPQAEGTPSEEKHKIPKRKEKPQLKRRIQQLAAVGLTSLALLGADKAANQIDTNTSKPITTGVEIATPTEETEFTIGQTHFTFKELPHEEKPAEHIQPSTELQKIITTETPLMETLGLDSKRIQDEKEFTKWIMDNMKDPSIQEIAGITDLKNPTPDQLVKLASAIVIANESYDENASLEDLDTIYRQPIDKNLREKIPMQCEGYSSATLAVFDKLKQMYPDTLTNTYMTSQSAIQADHTWTTVFTVNGPDNATISYVDPAADDPDWEKGHLVKIGIVALFDGFYDKGLVKEQEFYKLGKLTREDLDDIVNKYTIFIKPTNSANIFDKDKYFPEYKALKKQLPND